MLTPKPLALEIEGVPEMRYTPLPGLDVADYVDKYADRLETSGAFDSLKYSAAQLSVGQADTIDLAGLAALGSAVAKLLTGGAEAGKLRALILDHFKTFKVEVLEGSEWLALDSEEAVNAHLQFEHMIEVVRTLAGGVLLPLGRRLLSSVAEAREKSPKPSPENPKES